MEGLDMYSNELVWYFHHLHEANVRTEDPQFILVIISPSLPFFPCCLSSSPPFFFCFFYLLSLPFSSSLFSSLWLTHEENTRALQIYDKNSNLVFKESPNFYLVKTFILLSLLFPVLSKMPCTSRKREKKLKPGRSLNCNVSIQKNTEVSTIIIGNSM